MAITNLSNALLAVFEQAQDITRPQSAEQMADAILAHGGSDSKILPEVAAIANLPPANQSARGDIRWVIDQGKYYTFSDVTNTWTSLAGDGTLTLGESSTTAYRGDRGKIAYDHSQTTGNPHGTVAANISDFTSTVTGIAGGLDTALISAHTSASDPHSQYTTTSEATSIASGLDATLLNGHVTAPDPHPQYTTDSEASSIASGLDSTLISNHVSAIDPHSQYLLDSEFYVVNALDVDATSITEGDVLMLDNAGIFKPFKLTSVSTETRDPTGFLDNESLSVTYNATTRRITLTSATASIRTVFNGVIRSWGTQTWVSDEHPATAGLWYLYSQNGTDFLWSNSPWEFYNIQVAAVRYISAAKYLALREVHGVGPWNYHRTAHIGIGTIRNNSTPTGGTITGYAYGSTATADRRVGATAVDLLDEDLLTAVAALTDGGPYSHMFLGSATVIDWSMIADDEIIHMSGVNAQYQNPSTTSWANIGNNNYANVYLIALPTTQEQGGLWMRWMFFQPQAVYANPSLAREETFGSLNLADLKASFAEFLPVAKLTIKATASYFSIENIEQLYNSRVSSVGGSASSLSASSISVTPVGTISSSNVQSAIAELDTDIQSRPEILTNEGAYSATGSWLKIIGIVLPSTSSVNADWLVSIYASGNKLARAQQTGLLKLSWRNGVLNTEYLQFTGIDTSYLSFGYKGAITLGGTLQVYAVVGDATPILRYRLDVNHGGWEGDINSWTTVNPSLTSTITTKLAINSSEPYQEVTGVLKVLRTSTNNGGRIAFGRPSDNSAASSIGHLIGSTDGTFALGNSGGSGVVEIYTNTGRIAFGEGNQTSGITDTVLWLRNDPIGTSPASIGNDASVQAGGFGTTAWAMWSGALTPLNTNYGLYISPTTAELNGTTYSYLSVGSAGKIRASATDVLISPTGVDAERFSFRKYAGTGSYAAIYNGTQVTAGAGAGNYTLLGSAALSLLNVPSDGTVGLRVNNTSVLSATSAGVDITGALGVSGTLTVDIGATISHSGTTKVLVGSASTNVYNKLQCLDTANKSYFAGGVVSAENIQGYLQINVQNAADTSIRVSLRQNGIFFGSGTSALDCRIERSVTSGMRVQGHFRYDTQTVTNTGTTNLGAEVSVVRFATASATGAALNLGAANANTGRVLLVSFSGSGSGNRNLISPSADIVWNGGGATSTMTIGTGDSTLRRSYAVFSDGVSWHIHGQ